MDTIRLPGSMEQGETTRRDLATFNSTHKEVVRMSFAGEKTKLIAERLGITVDWVREIIKSQQGQEMLQTLEHMADLDTLDMDEEVQALGMEGVVYMREAVSGVRPVPESIRAKIAMRAVEMVGRGPIQRMVGSVEHTHVGQIALEAIKERGKATHKALLEKMKEIEVVAKETDQAPAGASQTPENPKEIPQVAPKMATPPKEASDASNPDS